MIGLFKRAAASNAPDLGTLGSGALALPVAHGALVPQGCIGVAFDKAGRTRRIQGGGRIDCGEHEQALAFHPGPYSADLLPFAAAPELGLRLAFVVDSPDPRVAQQRFDLYLASEAPQGSSVPAFCALLEATLQRELAQGHLDLPPCTSPDEWDAFRAGLHQLLYTRFGLVVDDCVPVDLGDSVDYAALLLARAADAPPPQPAHVPAEGKAVDPAGADRAAMRRLFLELPCVTSALRLIALPPGPALFRAHQGLLQRLAQASLEVATMPALELAAPGQRLGVPQQALRAQHALAALADLDEAWALLARSAHMDDAAGLLDDLERITANLELHCAARRSMP